MKNDEPNEAETIMHPCILCMFGCIFPDSVLFFFSVQLKKKRNRNNGSKFAVTFRAKSDRGIGGLTTC